MIFFSAFVAVVVAFLLILAAVLGFYLRLLWSQIPSRNEDFDGFLSGEPADVATAQRYAADSRQHDPACNIAAIA